MHVQLGGQKKEGQICAHCARGFFLVLFNDFCELAWADIHQKQLKKSLKPLVSTPSSLGTTLELILFHPNLTHLVTR